MSVPTEQLNGAVSNALQALGDAAQNGPYSDQLQGSMDDMTLALQTIQNDLVTQAEQDLLTALKSGNAQLSKLNEDMQAYDEKLDNAAVTIKKVSGVIGTVTGIIGSIVSAGVL